MSRKSAGLGETDMSHLIVEIKARCDRPDDARKVLLDLGADFRGLDHQIDTYFRVPSGRLKLRQGNIETTLIHYDRPTQAGPKDSLVHLHKPTDADSLRQVLVAALGILVVVDKSREIYFIENVKFHIDDVRGLGRFVEIEAIGDAGDADHPALLAQCRHYMEVLGIVADDLIECSYSDMLLNGRPSSGGK